MKSKGFTLIELMIVVVVLSILAAIAFPAYNGQVLKSRRSDAKAAVTSTAQRLERCMTLYGAYNHNNCGVTFPVTSDEGFFSVTLARTATTFTLTATPVTGSSQAGDAECTTFTMTHLGVKGATGTAADRCW